MSLGRIRFDGGSFGGDLPGPFETLLVSGNSEGIPDIEHRQLPVGPNKSRIRLGSLGQVIQRFLVVWSGQLVVMPLPALVETLCFRSRRMGGFGAFEQWPQQQERQDREAGDGETFGKDPPPPGGAFAFHR